MPVSKPVVIFKIFTTANIPYNVDLDGFDQNEKNTAKTPRK
jgi:hypothetical protein